MSKLISTYAKATGLKISKPNVKEAFYPVPFERYITIQSGSGQAAKNYDYFNEVIRLIKPILDRSGITILHLGGKDDPQLNEVFDLRGKTSIMQSHFLLKRTLLHLGGDSWISHCVGWNYRPLVTLFGSTNPDNHGPYWYDVSKTILLESHRWGGKPTFVSQEPQKSINVIAPETVANSVLKLLDLPLLTLARKSLLIGPIYQHTIFELIPDTFPTKDFFPNLPITIRLDYHFDQTNLAGLLSTGRKVNIVTNKMIDLNLVNAYRQSIMSYSHELNADNVDIPTIEYVRTVKTLVSKTTFFCKEKDESKVASLRFQFFDIINIEPVVDLTKTEAINWARDYLNLPDTEENRLDISSQLCHAKVRANKFILASGSVYLSFAHFKAKKPIKTLAENECDVIDDPDFFKELNHLYIYSEQ